ncbi:beta-lactamase domain protein [Alkaliphilus metalliredigens QYMF]|uniref:Beta-lactamase domain protein n=1 Tax=Alkaliphilus metalliredigens (strain QYMF) TaxID=293826 RepID=A6TMT5_ALKMQ|nr:ComEC/Rec2 family competence protein [Alkaliphilus metalliredigens]ABR47503.1 beta-lactamase domain protein [Alkaliphilus metalliredigens QYMF]
MHIIFAILWFIALLGVIIGVNYPEKVLWGSKTKTEGKVLKTYGMALIIFFLLFGISLEYLEGINEQGDYVLQGNLHNKEDSEIGEDYRDYEEVKDKKISEVKEPEQVKHHDDELNLSNEVLKIHFIDVGQGDATLIMTPAGKTILVDAGDRNQGETVVSYIKAQGIETIDLLIASHPHADHIGGMASVVQVFEIGEVYMPEVTANTKTFETLLLAIKEKNLKIKKAKAGVEFNIDSSIRALLIAPHSEHYSSLNDYSAVLRVDHGENSFLITGDVEAQSENEMLKSKYPLQVDVLRVSHHGSNSSTIPAFLEAVAPTYGVISVGAENRYGHPHKELMERLGAFGMTVYRTDEAGTIVATSDGREISFDTVPSIQGAGRQRNSELGGNIDIKEWLLDGILNKIFD